MPELLFWQKASPTFTSLDTKNTAIMNSSFSNTFFSLLSVVAISASNATAKLVAWYPLDESPAAALPVTENISGNDASLIGYDADPVVSYVTRGVSSARQNLGLAYQFDKDNTIPAGGGFNLGAAAAVQPTDQFTIAFFFQPQTFNLFDRFFETLVGNNNAQQGMRIDTGAAGNRVRALVRSAAAGNTNFTHPTALKNDGTWYFFAFRYDSTGPDPFRLTLIEMNSDPVDEAAITSATSAAPTLNTGAMSFPHEGNSLVGVELLGADNPNNFGGIIDEFAIFDNSDGNGVLSDAQLLDVFNYGPSGVELISSFTTDLASASPGNPATLSWVVDDSLDSLVLDDGNGGTVDLLPLTTAGEGSTAVTPAESTTYMVRAVKGDAANVSTIRILAGAAPEIASFSSSDGLISSGSPVDLTWSVAGADSLSLDPDGIDVTGRTTINLTPVETTNYVLRATNGFGTSTAMVSVEVIDGPVPVHRYVSSILGEVNESIWNDLVGDRDWGFTGGLLGDPLNPPSANTNIMAPYTTVLADGSNGASAGTFQYNQFSAEIWFRPGELTADHQVLFETGGGQNGLGALITDTNIRLIGSTLNVRNLDVTISTVGLNLADFIQLVITNDADADLFTASLRDTLGNVRSVSEDTDVTVGGNGAGLFTWASVNLGVSPNDLGGRTELPDASPAGLTGFSGEIGIVNIYDQILDDTAIGEAFDLVATIGQAPDGLAVTAISFDDDTNQLTLTWNSINGQSYLVEFSSSLEDETWFELDDPIVAVSDETTQVFGLPPNLSKLFFRVVVATP